MSIISRLLKKLNPSDLTEEEKAAIEAELKDDGEGKEKAEEKVEAIEEKKDEVKDEAVVEELKEEVKEEPKAEEPKAEAVEEVKEEIKEEAEDKAEEIIPIPDKEEAAVEVKEEIKEEAKEESLEEPIKDYLLKDSPLQESEAVTKLVAAQEKLLAEKEELEKKLEEMSREKSLVAAQKKIDDAMAEGWLTPAMLKESADGAESVFVEMAKVKPEWFDRLKLVMAPKVLKKTGITEESSEMVDNLSDDEAKFEVISKFAAENNIPYIEAARKLSK